MSEGNWFDEWDGIGSLPESPEELDRLFREPLPTHSDVYARWLVQKMLAHDRWRVALAQEDDQVEARRLLLSFCGAILNGEEVGQEVQFYLASAFLSVLEGESADVALHLKNPPNRPRGARDKLIRDIKLCIAYRQARAGKKQERVGKKKPSKEEARRAAAESHHCSSSTVRRAVRRFPFFAGEAPDH